MKDLSGLEVNDYFEILWRRRWYFLVVLALVSAGGIVFAKMQPSIYRSEAKISVDIPLSTLSRSSASIKERIEVIREQLSTRSFIERMIQQTGAYGWGANSDFVMERALENVRKNIIIGQTSERTFRIAYRASDPSMAQNVTRQFTEELIRASKRSTTDNTLKVDKFVEEKFKAAEANLQEQSEKIRLFKQRHAGQLPEQVESNINAMNGLRTRLNNLENSILQARKNKEITDYQYHDSVQTREELKKLQELSGSPAVAPSEATPEERAFAQKMETLSKYKTGLAQILTKYTENHPDVSTYKREIDRLERDVDEAWMKLTGVVNANDEASSASASPPLITREAIALDKLERDYMLRVSMVEEDIAKMERECITIQNEITDYEMRLRVAPTLVQDLENLLREEARLKKQYDSYEGEKLKAEVATAVETDKDNEVYRIIDEANFPIYPESSQFQLLMMSICGGLILGIAAAFGRELLDTTISSEEEAKKVFNLPVLAGIPVAQKKSIKIDSEKTELRKTA